LLEIDSRLTLIRGYESVLDIASPPGGFAAYLSTLIAPEQVTLMSGIGDCKFHHSVKQKNFMFFEWSRPFSCREAIQISSNLRDIYGKDYDLVLGDIAPCTDVEGPEKEMEMFPLLLTELTIALNRLKKGGNMVVKFLSAFYPCTQSVIVFLKSLFTKIWLMKLRSSRSSSPEFYLVGIDYRSSGDIDLAQFGDLLFNYGIVDYASNVQFIAKLQDILVDFTRKQNVGLWTVLNCAKNIHFVPPGKGKISKKLDEGDFERTLLV